MTPAGCPCRGQGDAPPFGFSDNPDTWLPLPADWAALTVERQIGDPASTLEFYRQAIELRRDRGEFDGATIEWLDSPADTLAFRRSGGLVCVLNAGADAMELPDGEVLLSAAELVEGKLPPDAAAWLV